MQDLAVGEINGDTRNDIAVLRNDGVLVVADFDLDVIATTTIARRKNDGNGTFASPATANATVTTQNIATGKMGGDAKFDVVVSGSDGRFAYLNSSGAGWAAPKVYDLWPGEMTAGMPIALGKVCRGFPTKLSVVAGYFDEVKAVCGNGGHGFDNIVEPHGKRWDRRRWTTIGIRLRGAATSRIQRPSKTSPFGPAQIPERLTHCATTGGSTGTGPLSATTRSARTSSCRRRSGAQAKPAYPCSSTETLEETRHGAQSRPLARMDCCRHTEQKPSHGRQASMLALALSSSCADAEEVTDDGFTFLERVELQRRVCEIADECGMYDADADANEACALGAVVLYEKMGPACPALAYAYWECTIEVKDSKGCAGWSLDDLGVKACFDQVYSNDKPEAPASECLP
ncbi:MAG: hypothetical protein K1X88_23525 [Nannocystaceae bacterium]|nr:hypothetical protein [Nannocystaceae bacterium]